VLQELIVNIYNKGVAKKILLVEDDQQLSRMYERAFNFNDDLVEVTNNGQKALERLRNYENKPDVIILDIIVPGMSGLDILRNIKEDINIRDIPIVVLTNSLNKENEKLMISLGADLFLIKLDNEASDVVKKVTELLNKDI